MNASPENSTAEVFLHEALVCFYQSLSSKLKDNFDYSRFQVEVGAHLPPANPDYCATWLTTFVQNYKSFFSVWEHLVDSRSKALYFNLIVYRMAGYEHFRINPTLTWQDEKKLKALAQAYASGAASKEYSGILGRLVHYKNVPFLDKKITLDAWWANVGYTFFRKSYFFNYGAHRIQPELGDYVIDAGACLGDTAIAFSCAVGAQGRVYSFDPLPLHIEIAESNAEKNKMVNISFYPWALGETTKNLENSISIKEQIISPGFQTAPYEQIMPTMMIDEFVFHRRQEDHPINFIKMDVEGAELQALRGARKTIEAYKPKLAISLYHNLTDLFEIPNFIAEHFPFYDFYLDHYTIHTEETVLFCMPKNLSV